MAARARLLEGATSSLALKRDYATAAAPSWALGWDAAAQPGARSEGSKERRPAGPLCLCQVLSSDYREGSAGLHVHTCTEKAVCWGHGHLVVCRADTQREGQEIRGPWLGWRAENCYFPPYLGCTPLR